MNNFDLWAVFVQAFTPECWLQVFFKLVELQDPEPGQQLAAQFGAQDKLAQSMQASWIHSQMRQLAAIHVVKQVHIPIGSHMLTLRVESSPCNHIRVKYHSPSQLKHA